MWLNMGQRMGPVMGGTSNGMMNAGLTGKIISVDGSTITIEVLEQHQNSENANRQSRRGFRGRESEWTETGVKKTIIVNEDADISGQGMGRQNRSDNTSESATQVSDMK
jgi:hypothetical protein